MIYWNLKVCTMNEETFFVEEHRDLSTKERDLIHWLLVETNQPDLQEQIGKAKIVSRCSCGCPTIDLQVVGVNEQPINLHLSASGYSLEGIPVGVILHIKNGLLAELEAYSETGIRVFDLPEIDKLQVL